MPNRSTRVLAFGVGELDLTFDSDVTFPILSDVKAQAPDAVCEARTTNVSANLLVNRDASPFDNARAAPRPGLALDRKPFNDILSQGHALVGARHAAAADRRLGHAGGDAGDVAGLRRRTSTRTGPKPARSWKGSVTATDKPLKVKVSTRNIAIYRDPAVILIDQLKAIHIDGELEPIDTTVWYSKVTAQGLLDRPEPDRPWRRRPRRHLSR